LRHGPPQLYSYTALYSAIERCILYSYTVLYTIQPLQHPSELELTLLCCECALCCPLLRCCLLFLRSNSYLARKVYRALLGQYTAARVTVAGLRRVCTAAPAPAPASTPLYCSTYIRFTQRLTYPHGGGWLVPARVRAPHGIAQQNGEYKYGKALAPGPPRL
jgi:hypothetical protein